MRELDSMYDLRQIDDAIGAINVTITQLLEDVQLQKLLTVK